MSAHQTLDMFTIYERPQDFPTGYMVRRWAICQGNVLMCEVVCKEKTLELARETLQRVHPGLYRLPRQYRDDPCIVETWL